MPRPSELRLTKQAVEEGKRVAGNVKARHALAAGAAVTCLLFLLGSPMLLALAPDGWRIGLAKASDFGQAYGFASALLSAAAFGAISYSIRLQVKESRLTRFEAHRPIHTELMAMAINDPALMAAWDVEACGFETLRRRVYLNLNIASWHSKYLGGTTSDEVLQVASDSLFRGEAGRDYWEWARLTWRRECQSRESLRFWQIVDAAYRAALKEDIKRPDPPKPIPTWREAMAYI